MKKPELLAPVGTMESLIAAIEAGCDAVYLGGTLFGARKFAGNFNNEEIVDAIKYAHSYQIKVYVTVNTLIYENEIEEFIKYIEFLHKNNVDAIIIQDIGMMDYLRKTYPNLNIHASTQMHIHNLEGTKFVEELGLERVVLARETDIDTIKDIKNNTNIELEVFIHGALCMSYSGECLMSSLIGGRSGNRGECAQCCRLPYELYNDSKKISDYSYLLSTKDLNTVSHLHKLIEIGVDSFKIEGRMKSPEYVYQVVKIYRKIIDSYFTKEEIDLKEDLKKLQIIFNRTYTKGFLFNEDNNNFINPYRPNHMGINIGKVINYHKGFATIELTDSISRLDGIRIVGKKDIGMILTKIYKNKKEVEKASKGDIISIKVEEVEKNSQVLITKSNQLINEIKQEINEKRRKIKIQGKVLLKKNENIIFTIFLKEKAIVVYGDIVEEANNVSITDEEITKQLKKFGNTPFELDELQIEKDENTFIRVSSLNEVRRKATEKLLETLLEGKPFIKNEYTINLPEIDEKQGYSVLVHNEQEYQKIKDKNTKYIYMNSELYNVIDDERKIKKLDRVILKHEENKNSLIGELGSVYKYKNGITDYSLNVVNSYSVAFLQSMGIKRVTLSYELNDLQIEEIINNYKNRYKQKPNLELIVSSIPEVMITKFNLLKYFNIENKNSYLKDKKGNKFNILNNNGKMIIKHYEKLELKDYQKYFNMGISTLRIEIEDNEDYKKLK